MQYDDETSPQTGRMRIAQRFSPGKLVAFRYRVRETDDGKCGQFSAVRFADYE